ncbi:SMP-30/gluconolactonase/LRE family protein [Polluticaenibacter yanchengensis]|uniref:ATP-binding protein n=1 Tax=Polluticaenibacter yanchengensis TaxID=3014562 RepID=A0ABT4UEV1_9BACT|nr:ATP-binding protein [Chitinophagaceae bacterium LY-5]
MKRIYFLLVLLFAGLNVDAQDFYLEKLWETDTIVKTPESVLIDNKRNIAFVSLIDGMSWDKDGKGGVAKMSLDGTELNQEWITGLNAPKGMGISGNRLFVADFDEVVVINIKKGEIEKKIKVEGAVGLNDLTIDDKGIIYVSDSQEGKIYKVEKDVPALYLDNTPKVNGLKFHNKHLYAAIGKRFVKIDINKKITDVAELPEIGDGIEPIGPFGDFILTSWIGQVYIITTGGKVETLLNTVSMKKNAADIGWNPQKFELYVPTFYGKTIAAYQLKNRKAEQKEK